MTRVDRYGFAVDDDAPTKGDLTRRAKDDAKERERESKWIYMLGHPDAFFGKKREKLESRILKGIPDAVRSRAWRYIIDRRWSRASDRTPIAELIARREDSDTIHQIRLDVSRTMPQVPIFATPEVQDALRQLLHAYSNVDQELGYTQSMAFIAATLLLYMDLEAAFWCFRSLMIAKQYRFRDFYTDGFPKLYELKKIWDYLLETRHMDFVRFLDRNSVVFENYAMSWFLCAFMDVDFIPVLRMRIFDRYAGFGTRALLTFGLVLVGRLKRFLMSGQTEEIVQALRRCGSIPEMKDWRAVIKDWDKVWMSEKDYKKLFAHTKVTYIPTPTPKNVQM
jgi:hypothetical protein